MADSFKVKDKKQLYDNRETTESKINKKYEQFENDKNSLHVIENELENLQKEISILKNKILNEGSHINGYSEKLFNLERKENELTQHVLDVKSGKYEFDFTINILPILAKYMSDESVNEKIASSENDDHYYEYDISSYDYISSTVTTI